MQSLTNLDTSFLHLESDRAPMHVGGIMLFAAPANEPMSFDRFRRHLAARLQTARVFRQRLHMPPMLLDNPQWVEDAEFCLDNHLHQHKLAGDLSNAALNTLASTFLTGVLRRDRPLWEMMYVEGATPADGFAVLLKVHHAALDGLSAEAVITGLLDDSIEPRQLPPDSWQAEKLPTLATTLRRRVGELTQAPAKTRELIQSASKIGGLMAKAALSPRYRYLPRFFTSPPAPFNRAITAERSYVSVQISLPLVKAIKNSQPGITLNDVVLAICAGATRRYLRACGDLPEASLVALVPSSRREQHEKNHGGNKVSSMLVRLATNIADPVQRLLNIHDNAQMAKEYNRDIPYDTLLDMLPSAAPALVLSSFAALRASRHLPPMFNMVITNVPGSPKPLYLDGAVLRNLSGMVGVYDGMALSFVVMSYLDQLSIGITTTTDAIMKPERLAQYLQEAAEELAEAVQQSKQRKSQHKEPIRVPTKELLDVQASTPKKIPAKKQNAKPAHKAGVSTKPVNRKKPAIEYAAST